MIGSFEIATVVPLMAVAAAYDVGQRRIPNPVNVALALTGTAAAWYLRGVEGLASSVAAAVLVGTLLWFAWRQRILGGGDLKLAVASAAWVGLDRLVPFLLATAIAGGGVAIACFLASSSSVRREVVSNLRLAAARAMPPVPISQGKGRTSVPYGAAIAVAALWTLYRG